MIKYGIEFHKLIIVFRVPNGLKVINHVETLYFSWLFFASKMADIIN